MQRSNRRAGVLMSIAACVSLAGCAAHDVQQAGKELGGQMLGQAVILFAFGPDALERHNERKQEERKRETNPYRSSITREEYLDWQQRVEFEQLYESLREANREYPFSERPVAEEGEEPLR